MNQHERQAKEQAQERQNKADQDQGRETQVKEAKERDEAHRNRDNNPANHPQDREWTAQGQAKEQRNTLTPEMFDREFHDQAQDRPQANERQTEASSAKPAAATSKASVKETGVVPLTLEMLDRCVDGKNSATKIIWRHTRPELVALPELLDASADSVSTVAGLVTAVIASIDGHVEKSANSLLKMKWRLIRGQFANDSVARIVEA